MSVGLVGRKVGMTRVFTEEGASVPVTVVEVQPNLVVRSITQEQDGYNAIQVTTGDVKASRVDKATASQYAKAKLESGRGLWEFRVDDTANYEVGGEVKLDIFTDGQSVDVTGTSKGKGFAGTIKRHNFAGKGNARVTTQNLTVFKVDQDNKLLLIKGPVPGAPGGDVIVRPAIKVKR